MKALLVGLTPCNQTQLEETLLKVWDEVVALGTEEALALLKKDGDFDLIIVEQRNGGAEIDGIHFLETFNSRRQLGQIPYRNKEVRIILLTSESASIYRFKAYAYGAEAVLDLSGAVSLFSPPSKDNPQFMLRAGYTGPNCRKKEEIIKG